MSNIPKGYEVCPNCESAQTGGAPNANLDDCIICKGKGIVKMENKPELKLVGEDSNAFMILGLARRSAKKAGWTEAQMKTFQDEATSGDYDHLLQTCMKYFEVE